MTAVTIWGVAARERDVGEGAGRVGGRPARAEAVDRFHDQLPRSGVRVTVGHFGEQIGRMVYGEIATDGRLGVVCVLDDDTVTKIPGPVFFSPELVTIGEGVRTRAVSIASLAGLYRLALGTQPAGLGLHPIRWRHGDLRDAADRSGWPISWRTDAPLLQRALDRLGNHTRALARLHREPEVVLELRTRSGGHALLVDGELVASRGPLWLR